MEGFEIISVECNAAQFAQAMTRVARYIHNRAVIDAAAIAIEDIRRNTANGLDANNKTFPRWSDYHSEPGYNYSPTHTTKREKLGRTTKIKNLWINGDLLQGLHLEGKTFLTVNDAQAEIARGQMSHPRWKYHHLFLLQGTETTRRQEKAIARNIEYEFAGTFNP